ncbi:hypothetical protein MMMB2_0402 [Mycobacterium marinum MB2]|nr:hypothetical protein MMMB2_0402 [Mycobacterium marinum MB2]
MGCAVQQQWGHRRRGDAAVAGVRLVDTGIRRGLLDAGVDDTTLDAGVGGPGWFGVGQWHRAVGGVVAPDRGRGSTGSGRRAHRVLDRGDPADVSLGTGGVAAHDSAACRGRAASSRGRRTTVADLVGQLQHTR